VSVEAGWRWVVVMDFCQRQHGWLADQIIGARRVVLADGEMVMEFQYWIYDVVKP